MSSTSKMHPETYSTRYRPSSPLSPRSSVSHSPRSRSPHPARHRLSPSQQGSRAFRLDLPGHPGFPLRVQGLNPSSAAQSPAITINRSGQPVSMESPRLMREKQKELIARAQLTSKLAASPMSIKPEAPRLDPLGSPKGAVTPLALEEQAAADYFTMAGAGRFSPAASPSARSSRSSTSSSKDDKMKKHKVELFQ